MTSGTGRHASHLGESEVDRGGGGLLGCLLDGLRKATGTTEVRLVTICQRLGHIGHVRQMTTYSDGRLQLRVGAGEILPTLDGLAHATEDVLPVRTAEHGASAKECQRVILGASIVDGNVPEHVLGDPLREVDVDTQEVGYRFRMSMETERAGC